MRKMCILGSYLFNKFAASLYNGLYTASETGAGSLDHEPVHGGEFLGDGCYQRYTTEISVCMSLKLASDKIPHQFEIWPRFGRFVAKPNFFKSHVLKLVADPWLCLELMAFLLEKKMKLVFYIFFLWGLSKDHRKGTGRPVRSP